MFNKIIESLKYNGFEKNEKDNKSFIYSKTENVGYEGIIVDEKGEVDLAQTQIKRIFEIDVLFTNNLKRETIFLDSINLGKYFELIISVRIISSTPNLKIEKTISTVELAYSYKEDNINGFLMELISNLKKQLIHAKYLDNTHRSFKSTFFEDSLENKKVEFKRTLEMIKLMYSDIPSINNLDIENLPDYVNRNWINNEILTKYPTEKH